MSDHDYWHSVVGGIERARQELRPFNVSVNYLCYHHGDKKSYQEACHTIRDSSVDAVLIAPNFREETIELTSYLQENKIAYAFVDFNMEEANALTYIGQDSYKSGYISPIRKITSRRWTSSFKHTRKLCSESSLIPESINWGNTFATQNIA